MPRKKSNNKPGKPRLQRVSVRGELRSEPDWDRFAFALLQYVRIKADREAAAKRTPPEDAS